MHKLEVILYTSAHNGSNHLVRYVEIHVNGVEYKISNNDIWRMQNCVSVKFTDYSITSDGRELNTAHGWDN